MHYNHLRSCDPPHRQASLPTAGCWSCTSRASLTTPSALCGPTRSPSPPESHRNPSKIYIKPTAGQFLCLTSSAYRLALGQLRQLTNPVSALGPPLPSPPRYTLKSIQQSIQVFHPNARKMFHYLIVQALAHGAQSARPQPHPSGHVCRVLQCN